MEKPHRLRTLALGAGLVEYRMRVREIRPNWSPRIEMYLKNAGISARAPWCASFQQFITDRAAAAHRLHNPLDDVKLEAYVPSYVEWAHKTDRIVSPEQAGVGDLVAFNFHGERFDHIGMMYGKVDAHGQFRTLEGNTNVKGAREGDAVLPKWRNHNDYTCAFICWDDNQWSKGPFDSEMIDALHDYAVL